MAHRHDCSEPVPSPVRGLSRRFRAALLVSVGLLHGSNAGASSLFEIAGATTSPNALNVRAMGRGGATAFYNPALLPRSRGGTEIGVSTLVMHGDIELDDRPRRFDVGRTIYDARPEGAGTTFLPLPTADLPQERSDTAVRETNGYVTLGVVEPILSEKLVFGFYGVLPLHTFHRQDPFFPDEREQYFGNRLRFELLGDRAELAAFAASLASRPVDWLSIGVGADVTIATHAVTNVYVPDGSDQRTVLLGPDVETRSTLAPFFALATFPSSALTLTATAHMPVDTPTNGENRLRFFNYDYPDERGFVLQTFRAQQGYTPLRLSAGATWSHDDRHGRSVLELGGHILLSRWSQYRDRNGERPLDTWDDTVGAGIGGGVLVGKSRVTADLFYAPSPVPEQSGRTNYVDNHKLMSSLGITGVVRVFGVALALGAYLHGQLFIPRHTDKSPDARHPIVDEFPDGSVDAITGAPLPESRGLQTNNPGFPGFESSGFLAGAGLSISLPDVTVPEPEDESKLP